jgi:hypothetical protein
MSIYVILIIMLFAGVIGGLTNSLLSANTDPNTGKQIQSTGRCILIGIGATILVPLFLQIAQSNLIDDIHAEWRVADATACLASKASVVQVVKPDAQIKTDTVRENEKPAADARGDNKTGTTKKDGGLKRISFLWAIVFLQPQRGRGLSTILSTVLLRTNR